MENGANMKRRMVIAGAAVLGLAVLVGNCRARGPAGPGEKAPLVVEVRRGGLVVTVKGTGNIQAENANKIIPKINRGVTLSYLVPDGTRVASNDVVARFVTEEIERRVSELESALTDTQSKLDAATADLEIQVMDNTTGLKTAEQGLQTATMEREKFVQGDEPMELRTAELKVQNAGSDLARKRKRHEDLTTLLNEGFVTEDEVEEERMGVESAVVALDTAEIELKVLKTYMMPLKQATVDGALAKATIEVEKVTRQNAARLQTRTQAVELARKAFERSRKDLELARKELEGFEVKVLSDGIVMHGNPEEMWRRGEIQVGSQFHPGQVLMTIPDMAKMQAVVNVPEADIDKVRTNQAAQVKVEALSDKPFPGMVTKVAEVANPDGWWSSGVKEFKIEIAITNGTSLKPGFSCEAEISTETIPSCLYLPVQAVFLEDGKYYVYLERGGGKKLEVTIGRASSLFVELVNGVKEGAKVLLSKPESAMGARPPSS